MRTWGKEAAGEVKGSRRPLDCLRTADGCWLVQPLGWMESDCSSLVVKGAGIE